MKKNKLVKLLILLTLISCGKNAHLIRPDEKGGSNSSSPVTLTQSEPSKEASPIATSNLPSGNNTGIGNVVHPGLTLSRGASETNGGANPESTNSNTGIGTTIPQIPRTESSGEISSNNPTSVSLPTGIGEATNPTFPQMTNNTTTSNNTIPTNSSGLPTGIGTVINPSLRTPITITNNEINVNNLPTGIGTVVIPSTITINQTGQNETTAGNVTIINNQTTIINQETVHDCEERVTVVIVCPANNEEDCEREETPECPETPVVTDRNITDVTAIPNTPTTPVVVTTTPPVPEYEIKTVRIVADSKDVVKSRTDIVYPYHFRNPNTGLSISKLFNTDGNYNFSGSMLAVDAQVAFSVTIPEELKAENVEIISSSVELNLVKISLDGFYDTELFCLTDIKRCSGHKFRASGWVSMVNPTFWQETREPVSTTFSDVLVSNANITPWKGVNFYNLKKQFDLSSLFKLSAIELNQLMRERSSLTFVIADDTKLRTLPEITVQIKVRK